MAPSDGTEVVLGILGEWKGLQKATAKKTPVPLMSGVPKRAQPIDPVKEFYKRHGIRIS